MTSTNSLPRDNPEVVAALERAFQDVWAVLYAHLPLDGAASKEQAIALSQTLVALAADGITDPQELRRKALETMALAPR
jgi:hypothetical protein